jgi:hypothetical protein
VGDKKMIIANGYNDEETKIQIQAGYDGTTELWIDEKGKDGFESLAYITPNELLELKREIDQAIIDAFQIGSNCSK